jgi:hypothetical protein
MAAAVPFGSPIFTVSLVPTGTDEPELVLAAGGGGSSKTGIRNQIVRADSGIRCSFCSTGLFFSSVRPRVCSPLLPNLFKPAHHTLDLLNPQFALAPLILVMLLC